MEPKTEKRFHNLTLEQVQALDQVLTEVIPIHGRGNFPTLQVRAKDIIRVVKDRLIERDIQVKDIRLNGATASYILVRDNGLGYRDLDIIFGVELPRQEDFQVIKEVVLGSLRDLLPCGVNRRKITCLTMKEAYVQKMVKVFNEHDRWSLISLSNNRAKTVGLRFVSSLRRQFEFSVDSFQIILDRMLEFYWETERKQGGTVTLSAGTLSKRDNKDGNKEQEPPSAPKDNEENKDSTTRTDAPHLDEAVAAFAKELPREENEGKHEAQLVSDPEINPSQQAEDDVDDIEDVPSDDISEVFELCEESGQHKESFNHDYPSAASSKTLFKDAVDPVMTRESLKLQTEEEIPEMVSVTDAGVLASQEATVCEKSSQFEVDIGRTENTPAGQDSHFEFSFPPPAKKTCSTSQDIVPEYCPSPKLQRKMSRKLISKPEKWSLLSDVSDLTTQLFAPIDILKPAQPTNPTLEQVHSSDVSCSKSEGAPTVPTSSPASSPQKGKRPEQTVKPKKPPDLEAQSRTCLTNLSVGDPEPADPISVCPGSGSWVTAEGEPIIAVEAKCMYGDFDQAMEHLRHRLIATHNPEEIRGGGLLKYSDLLVRNFRPASETEIKSLERYMCSRFFIDFPDVSEQQRKIEAYLHCHFVGSEEASKYDYLMTLRRVIDESTVCLMGHERRQTLNMITVLALRVLGEQNAIPNTANVTCFYQPAPYMSEPIYNSYFIPQAQPPLVYHPYPLHVHMQTGLV
ncbi:uncharacterized protein LOC106516412 [Austrofundulus limnaeus]|uniref:polynucleotide adenylyltransferase n=1 Tax=Austrofundulus limnaeus TaxID=52670 RepID=A0A2I4B379_AUSLI|nr:PREDICTED: uncharacterized protein LOC106516412 [Austrofundulus limnaeus]